MYVYVYPCYFNVFVSSYMQYVLLNVLCIVFVGRERTLHTSELSEVDQF